MLYHIFDLRFVKLAAEAVFLAHIEYVTKISTYNGMCARAGKTVRDQRVVMRPPSVLSDWVNPHTPGLSSFWV
ncbi:MAG: hypothetical protein CMB11_07590 [Euryarchaeota archaeon]|nr:hypothetical protein [Euryarchaeota archaeon]|tara:strand:- start:4688 stop:4906 length:219 start_codon:yes stop_codon:yes gene_type:complete